MIRNIFFCFALFASSATLAKEHPNFVVIWGDDIGYASISAYNQGTAGCWTPNIDRIAREGALFTDAYGEFSSTAGPAALITGQSPFRTGLTDAVLPGADVGLQVEDPTIAEYLKTKGYMTAHYGKHHLGDRDDYLPTNRGFDEFFGTLYPVDVNAEQKAADHSKGVPLDERYDPRGVIRSSADGRIEDTGPLTRQRMETLDDEVTTGALDFIERAHAADKPFFLWWNSTRTQIDKSPAAQAEDGVGPGADMEHVVADDRHVGQILDKLDALGLTGNTLVMYSSDNGPGDFSSPDSDPSPANGDRNDNDESHFRVPLVVRWPGTIEPGTLISEIISHLDWFPTIAAALGNEDIKDELEQGIRFGKKRVKVYLDGYNLLPFLQGSSSEWPRQEFFYFSDAGDLLNIRHNDWKIIFSEQRAPHAESWSDPFVLMHAPGLINLREDSIEGGVDESTGYPGWYLDRLHVLAPAQDVVGQFLISFEKFPPREQIPANFSIVRLTKKLQPSTE